MTSNTRRSIILKKTLALAARHGFSGMTTAALAKSMKVSEPVIYQHFNSKSDLIETLVENTISAVMQEFTAVTAYHVDPLEALRGVIQSYPAIAGKFR